MKAVIMAGGQGTRLRSVSADLPKPMVPVLGKPILQYQIENLRDNGITEIKLIIGYLGDAIRACFGDGSAFGVKLSYFCEDHPMGTAGALYALKDELGEEDCLLLMGDLMLSVDFRRFLSFHREMGGAATLFVHPNAHPYDSDLILTDQVGRTEEYTEAAEKARTEAASAAEGIREKCKTAGRAAGETLSGGAAEGDAPALEREIAGLRARAQVRGVVSKKAERTVPLHNQVNSGIYAFSRALLDAVPMPRPLSEIEAELCAAEQSGASEEELRRIRKSGKVDLDRDVIRPLIEAGSVYAYHSTEYVKDMGTPDRYEAVTADLKNGIISGRNLSKKQKCIFLDRDGTINKLNGFVKRADQIELIEGAAEAIRRINGSEYLAIVVTNQPVIARGECSFEELDEIHAKLETELGATGAYLDDLFYCPHHTDRGFAGEVAALKFDCACRKPKTGLIMQAAERYNIDLDASWMIGDMTQDILCGARAGLQTVLVKTGKGGSDGKYEIAPTLVCEDLKEAVERILGAEKREQRGACMDS